MSKTIYKYSVPVDDEIHVFDLPRSTEIVHVDCQFSDVEVVQFWAVVDLAVSDTHTRRFTVVGTGHTWSVDARHVGSAMAPPFVWHLLELDS